MPQPLHLDLRQVAVPQLGIERKQHLVPRRQVPLGPARIHAPALHEPVVPDVVRRPVPPRNLRRERRVLRHQHVERDALTVLVLPEHAEVPRQPLLQLVPGALVEMDGEPDGARAERMRRAHCAAPSFLRVVLLVNSLFIDHLEELVVVAVIDMNTDDHCSERGRGHCAAGAWHGRGLVCYASSGKEGNRRLPEQILSDADPQLESPTAAQLIWADLEHRGEGGCATSGVRRKLRCVRGFMLDLRQSLRGFLREPGFCSIAVLALAVGVGSSTAMFSIVDTALLRPLPYTAPERQLLVASVDGNHQRVPMGNAEFLELQKPTNTLDAFGAFYPHTATVMSPSGPRQAWVANVSASLFRTLGIQPVLGRAFEPAEDIAGGPPVVIVSDAFWRRELGADPAVLGRNLEVDSSGGGAGGAVYQFATI